jgi:hypothetical protein
LSVLFLAATLLPGLVLSGADSLYRAYAFAGVFVILVNAALWSAAFVDRRPQATWLGVLGVALCLFMPLKGFLRFYPRETLAYAAGAVSTRQALSSISRSSHSRTTFEDFTAARSRIPPRGRMLHLCYEPGPGYCIPAPVIVCEPSHSFGGRYHELLLGEPRDARRIFHDLGIDHFGVNLQAQLFLGLPYSPLFRGDSLRENFTVRWQRGDFYLLTWRGPRDPPPSEELLQGLAKLQAEQNRFQRLHNTWVARMRESPHDARRERLASRKEQTDGRR